MDERTKQRIVSLSLVVLMLEMVGLIPLLAFFIFLIAMGGGHISSWQVALSGILCLLVISFTIVLLRGFQKRRSWMRIPGAIAIIMTLPVTLWMCYILTAELELSLPTMAISLALVVIALFPVVGAYLLLFDPAVKALFTQNADKPVIGGKM